ncbi:DUF3278 domain-containing protein [Apilactobacillus xinyiensis]|uniref:DUF3278 domain-containing protein n=1 Tax=Apilactobacillus xinyiensis TaxID=2841032 RepID=UPI001C7D5D9D|nr:DUF3278 domain-containing protein [Apilactobacillus xinyiensis]
MKKSKESFYTKLVRRIYGIQGEFDEYKQQQVNKIGNKAFIFLFEYLSTSMIIFSIFLVSSINKELILLCYLLCNFIAFFIVIFYLAILVSKSKLDRVESYDNDDYINLVKKSKKKAILGTIGFFLVERLISLILELVDNTSKSSFISLIISPIDNIIWLVGSLIAGIAFYFIMLSRIKK